MINMVNLAGNGAPGASGNVPAPGYILKLELFFVLFMYYIVLIMNTTTCHAITFSLIYIMNCLLNYGIKICPIKPRFLIGALVHFHERSLLLVIYLKNGKKVNVHV
jgi:hypothetical protein